MSRSSAIQRFPGLRHGRVGSRISDRSPLQRPSTTPRYSRSPSAVRLGNTKVDKRPTTPDGIPFDQRYVTGFHQMVAIAKGSLQFKGPWGKLLNLEGRGRRQMLDFNTQRALSADLVTARDVENRDLFEIPMEHDRLIFIADACEGDASQMILVPAILERIGGGRGFLFHGGDIYPVAKLKHARRKFWEAYAGVEDKISGMGNHEWWGHLREIFTNEEYNRLMGSPPHLYFSLVHPRFRFIWLDSGANGNKMDEPQSRWCVHQLVKAREQGQLAILGTHHPMYVDGARINNDFQDTIKFLTENYHVPLVFTGHEHNFQHYLVDGVHHLMAGNGGGFLTPNHKMKSEITPQAVYPSSEQSRAKFRGSWLKWVRAMRETGNLYKGFLQLDVVGDELVLDVVVRDNFADPKEGRSFLTQPKSHDPAARDLLRFPLPTSRVT